MLGYDLIIHTCKLPIFQRFEWDIFPNFCVRKVKNWYIYKWEFQKFMVFLTLLTYKISDFDLEKFK